MQHVPVIISIVFLLTSFLAAWIFYLAAGRSKAVLLILLIMGVVQSVAGWTGFYQTGGPSPRFVLLVAPGMLVAILLFITKRGRIFLDGLDLKKITLIHVVRVPVEIVLYYIFLAGLIPQLMTFEGRNFDIISGISAPIIYYLVFISRKAGRRLLLAWNLLCLGLLINVVAIAVLSAKTPFQQLSLDHPNTGITYFP
ncbi:MAG TPA: hypothetical protein VK644_07045, partial [Chitinophagaceae bacterium]|nr:hypothetical protein [Chitinophagaceae bacterium]